MGDKKMINLNNEKRNQAMSLRGRAVGSDVVIFHAETEKALSLSGASSEPIISAESKRDPRLIATQSPRITEKALSFLRLRGASGVQGISAPASCRKAHKRRFILKQWLFRCANASLRMTIQVSCRKAHKRRILNFK